MRTRSQTVAARTILLDLPPEIFVVLEAYLEIREIASFILTCSTLKHRLERFLYKKVFITPSSSNTNTRHFVSLLNRRPEIAHWIYKLIIYEYDVEHCPRLLASTFPNLLNLILQHEGPVALPSCGRRKLNALNALVKPQPALQNLTFNIELNVDAAPDDHELYYLPASTSTLFRHPSLVRVRLSHLDFTAFNRLPLDSFCHSNLRELFLDRCRYSAQNFQLFVHPCKKLSKIWLYQTRQPLYAQSELASILRPVQDTLRVLKSLWGHLAPLPEEHVNLRDFPNLHSIIMHPKLLFGKGYMVLPKQELSELIKSTLPPNLMILVLEGIVPVSLDDYDSDYTRLPMYEQWVRQFEDEEGQPIPDYDLNLMRHILEEKEDVAPKLEFLMASYLERMQNIPKDIIALAKKKGVRCCELYEHDEIAPPYNMSKHVQGEAWDDKERGKNDSRSVFVLHLDHSHGTMPWPKKPAGNF